MSLNEYIENLRRANLIESKSKTDCLVFLQKCIEIIESDNNIKENALLDKQILESRITYLSSHKGSSPKPASKVPLIDGLTMMQWDERGGPQNLGSYPTSMNLDLKLFMQIYSNHQAEGTAGMVSMSYAEGMLTSYYSGPDAELFAITTSQLEEGLDKLEKRLGKLVKNLTKEEVEEFTFSEANLKQFFEELL
jgi:hypothetical protein